MRRAFSTATRYGRPRQSSTESSSGWIRSNQARSQVAARETPMKPKLRWVHGLFLMSALATSFSGCGDDEPDTGSQSGGSSGKGPFHSGAGGMGTGGSSTVAGGGSDTTPEGGAGMGGSSSSGG